MSDERDRQELRAPKRTQTQRRAGGLGIALAMVVAFIALIWYAYTDVQRGQDQAEPPLIEAEEGPVRIRPENPGGRDIPNEDSTVFELAQENRGMPGQGQEANEVEKLLPPPELPADKPKPAAQDNKTERQAAQPPTGDAEKQARSANQPEVQAKDQAEAEIPDAPPSNRAEEGSAEETRAQQPQGAYRVQLGSLRTRSLARTEWQRLRKRYAESLGGLELSLQEVDLGERGTFFRVQAGPLTDAEAKAVCRAIRPTNPGGCLIVEP